MISVDPFDRTTARFLTIRYLVALATVGLLIVVAQVMVQSVLHRQEHDAMVINLAGRQRMLSQELCKAALAWQAASVPAERLRRLAEINRVRDEWGAAQGRLAADQQTPGMGIDNSPEVASALIQLQPVFEGMQSGAALIEQDAHAVERLLAYEANFLSQMEHIVGLYQAEAGERLARLVTLEACVCVVMLLVLVVEALLVFRPAVARLRLAMAERELLRDQEQLNRELVVAADVARGIGFDLHDGIGQTLTSLSFQAKSLEGSLTGQDQVRHVIQLRDGLDEALVQVRAAARRLCPVDIQVAGLEAALTELAESTRAVAGVECQAYCTPGLAPKGGEELYRIAQEAINNALRHGRARTISIDLRTDGRSGVLEICDDGSSAPQLAVDGVGLRSMRFRAKSMGGALAAGPRAEGGWRVACTFPLGPGPRP
jgi:signal transduction histidine kinase